METEVYEQMAVVENKHWWFVARRRILMTMLNSLRLPANAQILEAGCGTGGNLSMLAHFGKVAAFEPDAEAHKHAAAKGDYNVRRGSLPYEIPFETELFDLVAGFDVLEHLENDEASLNTLYQHLKPGGWGLFTVPAFSFLWSAHDERHHHKRRYYKAELAEKITAAGFTIHLATYFNTFLFPAIALIRLAKNIFKIKSPTDDIMPNPVLNRILKAIFSTECHFIKYLSFPVGVSLLLVVSKPGKCAIPNQIL